MTEVVQVAALDAHDSEENTEDYMGQEENYAEERSESENTKAHHEDDETTNETTNETEKTHVNGVENEQNCTRVEIDGSEDVNGKSQESLEPETNETENISDVALKKEKLLRSRKLVARSYVPKLNKDKADVTSKFEAMQKAREERSRQRNSEEQQKRKDQYVKEREWNRRKQQVKDR